MNASLHRKDGIFRDKTFKIFLEEQKLLIPKQCRRQNTFYHYNGRDEFQIEYFLQSAEIISMYTQHLKENQKTPQLITQYWCYSRVLYQKRIRKNKQKYAKDVEEDLKSFKSDITCENVAEKIRQLCTILNKNEEKQCKQPVKKRKKRKICWNPEIAAAAKTSKECYGKWKTLGKQNEPTQSAYIELRKSKKVLRSTQQKSASQKRNEKYQRIIDLKENDSEGFYQLIRKQRDPGNTCASAFIFKDVIVNTDPEIREAWADYFYDLATPSENPNFDPIFKDNVEKDVQNLHEYISEKNQHNIEHESADMVEKTILSLKNGKSPDELNISAEHLKYGGSLLISVLAYIINFLFKHVHIPALIKSGIVCPVFKNGGKPKDDPNSYRK
ncbi:unnamed protein product [Mytilus coruscus]|uniref:Uncharacterized protein n=1 Tax=Mytilus coruscus TaxID=42192 RepID=A0A6J8CX35_MYTCO|nr:unnamed protein product [Mytilus coruscus]